MENIDCGSINSWRICFAHKLVIEVKAGVLQTVWLPIRFCWLSWLRKHQSRFYQPLLIEYYGLDTDLADLFSIRKPVGAN